MRERHGVGLGDPVHVLFVHRAHLARRGYCPTARSARHLQRREPEMTDATPAQHPPAPRWRRASRSPRGHARGPRRRRCPPERRDRHVPLAGLECRPAGTPGFQERGALARATSSGSNGWGGPELHAPYARVRIRSTDGPWAVSPRPPIGSTATDSRCSPHETAREFRSRITRICRSRPTGTVFVSGR